MVEHWRCKRRNDAGAIPFVTATALRIETTGFVINPSSRRPSNRATTNSAIRNELESANVKHG